MRNCVLGVIGEVLPTFARREQLDPKESLQRDRLMDLLQVSLFFYLPYILYELAFVVQPFLMRINQAVLKHMDINLANLCSWSAGIVQDATNYCDSVDLSCGSTSGNRLETGHIT